METLSFNQSLALADEPVVQQRSEKRYTFSPARWSLRVGLVAVTIICVAKLSAANELVASLFAEIDMLQRLLEDPSRWLH